MVLSPRSHSQTGQTRGVESDPSFFCRSRNLEESSWWRSIGEEGRRTPRVVAQNCTNLPGHTWSRDGKNGRKQSPKKEKIENRFCAETMPW